MSREVVTHYKDRITHWELLTEPYLYATPRWVADVYEATVPVIRSANPAARIVGPCLYLRPKWANDLLKLGILDYVDIFSYHGYHMESPALRTVNRWASSDKIERPVFDTENSALSSSRFFCQSCPGEEFSGSVSPQESALRIARSLVSALGEGTDTFFYYWMVHYDAYEKHGSFLDHAGGLRSSAVAYALTGWRLRNLEPRAKKLHPGGIQSYSFANPEDTRAVAVFWSTGKQGLPALAGLDKNAVTVYDIMGGVIDTDQTSHPALAMPAMPVFMEADSLAILQQALSRLAVTPPGTH